MTCVRQCGLFSEAQRTEGRSRNSSMPPCGRITSADTTCPICFAAAATASTAFTAPTSPCTMMVFKPPPGCCFATSLTFAAFTIASAARTAAARHFVSTNPSACNAVALPSANVRAGSEAHRAALSERKNVEIRCDEAGPAVQGNGTALDSQLRPSRLHELPLSKSFLLGGLAARFRGRKSLFPRISDAIIRSHRLTAPAATTL